MKIGDTVKFNFAKKEKEGKIYKLFDKTVYIKADFPKHKGKVIIKKKHEIKSK